MAYLVRKLNHRDLLVSLSEVEDIYDIYADIPTREFKTEQGTISTWIIQDLHDLGEAVLAIAITSSKIEKMDFIVIDTELLRINELDFKQTYAGFDIPIPDLQDTHYDIFGITLKKLYNCVNVFKTIVSNEGDDEKYIVRFTGQQIKDLLSEAIKNNRVDESKAAKEIKKIIEQLKSTFPAN